MYDWEHTIVARITALGHGAVGIVRLSGHEAYSIADWFVRVERYDSLRDVPARQFANAVAIIDDAVWDRCLVVRFGAPRSFTGEDVVEIHLHGNPLILDRVIECAVSHGARPAGPGEFTMRAVLNGKLDLLQAEAVGEAIAAESAAAVTIAQRQLGGELSRQFHELRDRVVHAVARLELGLDFVEEGYSFLSDEEVGKLVDDVRHQVDALLRNFRSGARLRRGPRVVLLGRPNAGKSSFFNAVLGYSRALVSDRAGTTRDYLEERLVYGDVILHLVDTAGLREATDIVEAAGVQQTLLVAGEVDLALYLVDASDKSAVAASVDEIDAIHAMYADIPLVRVFTKRDVRSADGLSCSVEDPDSIDHVLGEIVRLTSRNAVGANALVTERQATSLREMKIILDRIDTRTETEVLSVDLRSLLDPLSSIVGEISNEHVLDAVFRDFCIGK